jgi:hypothetical protein
VKDPAEETGAWNAGQVKLFAKRIAESDEGKAWWSFHPKIRDAILSHHVLMTVFSMRGVEPIPVDDVRELRILIEERLANHHNLKVTP